MNIIKCMTENFNTYPKGNPDEKDTFETANNSMVREGLEGVEILEISFREFLKFPDVTLTLSPMGC